MSLKFKNLFQPYPIEESKTTQWLTAILFSMFISFFLIVFQPFGTNEIEASHKTLILAGYGGVTLVGLIFNFFGIKSLFPKLFKVENWNALKEIIWVLWIFFTIGLGNFLYTSLFFSFHGNFLIILLGFQLFTLAIGIIPVSVVVILSQNRMLKKNIASANRINSSLKDTTQPVPENSIEIHLFSENGKEGLIVLPDNLLFIESIGNYIKVHFQSDGKHKTKLMRNSLKNMADQLRDHPSFYRCHRAYLINLSRIKNVSGNAQGFKIKLDNTVQQVPVSRSYISGFRERL